MDQLEAILDRVAAGTQSAVDVDALRDALRRPQAVTASGDAAVAAGEISRSVVVTGEGHTVQVGKYTVPITGTVEHLVIGDHHGADAKRIAEVLGQLVAELQRERGKERVQTTDALSPEEALALVEETFGRPLSHEERQAALAFARAVGFKRQPLERAAARVAVGGAWPPLYSGELTPYLGLRTFQEQDAPLFYGRDSLVDELLAKVKAWSFLAVLGASGSGKSSVVRAGLIPRLRSGGVEGSEQWLISIMKPGARPLDALAVALTRLQGGEQLGSVLEVRRSLASNERALLLAMDLLRSDDQRRKLLLVVDQFEELWTLTPADEEARRRFLAEEREPLVNQLLGAIQAPGSPVKVIVTMRADFQHRVLEQPVLASMIDAHIARVYAMQPEDLAQAIQEPALQAGGGFEPGLAEELASRIAGRPGALPLLGFTLFELWKRRDDRDQINWAAYRTLGGVEGALAVRADAILRGHYADEDLLKSLRHALLKLVQPNVSPVGGRRRVPIANLVSTGATPSDAQVLLQPLVDERLLTTGRDDVTGIDYAEISHEALIGAWPTLTHWIEDAREDLRFGLTLEEAAGEWQGQGENGDYLWTGLRLASAEAWLTRAQPVLSEREDRFLAASQAAEQARRKEAMRRQEMELELANERARRAEERAAAEAQRAGRLRRLTVVLSLVLLIPLLLAIQWLRVQASPWQPVAAFPRTSVAALAAAPAGAATRTWAFCAGTHDNGLVCSVSGERWNVQQEGFPLGAANPARAGSLPGDVLNITDIAYDPLRPDHIYISTRQGGVLRSADGGRQWQELNGEGLPPTVAELVAAGGALLALPGTARSCAGETALYGSRDDGATWQKLSADNTLPDGIYATYLTSDGRRAYVGGKEGLYSSQLDETSEWQKEDGFGRICDIAGVPGSPEAVYIAEAGGPGGRLLRYQPGHAPQLLAEFRDLPQVIAPHPDPRSPIAAYLLLTWHGFNHRIIEINHDGAMTSLGSRPGWGPLTYTFDLLAVARPDRSGTWLWLGHTDGLLRYEPDR